MSLDKLIRLTVQVDVEPERANLQETLEYLKGLKGADRVELVDLEIVADPNAAVKKERKALERDFGADKPEGPPPVAPPLPETGPVLQRELAREAERNAKDAKDPAKVLDRIKIR